MFHRRRSMRPSMISPISNESKIMFGIEWFMVWGLPTIAIACGFGCWCADLIRNANR